MSEKERLKIKEHKKINKDLKRTGILLTVFCVAMSVTTLLVRLHLDKLERDEDNIPRKIAVSNNELSYARIKSNNGSKTDFSESYDYQFDGSEVIRDYKSKYVYFLVNKETHELEEFVIIDAKQLFDNDCRLIYDFNTEELLAIHGHRGSHEAYYSYLEKEYDWFSLRDAIAFLGEKEKDYYTKEEIDSIKKRFIESYRINETAKRQDK